MRRDTLRGYEMAQVIVARESASAAHDIYVAAVKAYGHIAMNDSDVWDRLAKMAKYCVLLITAHSPHKKTEQEQAMMLDALIGYYHKGYPWTKCGL